MLQMTCSLEILLDSLSVLVALHFAHLFLCVSSCLYANPVSHPVRLVLYVSFCTSHSVHLLLYVSSCMPQPDFNGPDIIIVTLTLPPFTLAAAVGGLSSDTCMYAPPLPPPPSRTPLLAPFNNFSGCAGAIGSAEWSGVKLRDVLRYAGFDEDNGDGVAHVQFEGLDSDTSGTCYGSSIPIDKAMGSHGDVLLAFSMNGRCCLHLYHCTCDMHTHALASEKHNIT